MRKMIPHLLVAFASFFALSSIAQDRIYTKDEVKEGTVTAVTDTEVIFTAGGQSQSLPKNEVKLIFKKNGEFLPMMVYDTTSSAAELTSSFLKPPVKRNYRGDRIYTVFNKLILANIYKEDDVYVYYKNADEDDRLAKTSLAAIVYADGKHKVFGSYANAARTLAETTPLTTGFTEEKVTYAAEKKITPPIQTKNTDTETEKQKTKEETKTDVIEPVKKEEVKLDPPKVEARKTASVMIVANKGADISVTMNNSPVGTIKAGDFKKLELAAGMYKIVMDDKQGNVIEKQLTIDESGKPQNVFFPDIDYKVIEDKKKSDAQAIIDQQKADAKRIADQKKIDADALAVQQKNTADSIAAEKKLLLEQKRNEAIALLKTMEDNISLQQEKCLATKEALITDSIQVVKGAKELDAASDNLLLAYEACKKETADQLTAYNETAATNNLKEATKAFLAKYAKDNAKLGAITYIQAMKSGKRPMSANLTVALKQSRAADLKFFIKKEEIESLQVEGQPVLLYALRNNVAPSVIKTLIETGASANNFSKRLESNSKIYESPLAVAASTKNPANIRTLIDAGAKLYPPFAQNKDKRIQVKYVMPMIKDDPAVVALFEKAGMTMVDYEAELKKAVDNILKDMITVDAGSFTIGCIPDVRVSCLASETPATELKMSKFLLNKFEVTRAQWAAIMEEDNVAGVKECANCPMSPVTYEMAVNFILKLNEVSGKKFRLPTEAEWEYAAAGGSKASRNKFAGSEESNDVAWTSENSGGVAHAVGEKKANAIGLYDMSGNVAEWCSSWFIENYYTQIPKENPKGPEQGANKVIRGGSYLQSNFSARVTRRWGEMVQFLNPGVGFRLALDAD